MPKTLILTICLLFSIQITGAHPAEINSFQTENQPDSLVRTSDVSTEPATKHKGRGNSLFMKLVGTKHLAELKITLDLYIKHDVPLVFRNFFSKLADKIFTYPIIILFILLTLFLILNIILVLLMINYTNKKKNHRDRFIHIYGTMYEEVLRSYLFGDIDWDTALVKLKKHERRQNRKILTATLLNFQDNLRGELDSQIPEIFVRLGLQKDSLKLAKSSFYKDKVQGIRELTNLYPEGAAEVIRDFVNHPNDLVRDEAQSSYIRLHPLQPFDFLRGLSSPFTQWTQLSVFNLFRMHQARVPAFIDYLDSQNPNVRNFCLRMIIFFQQVENASEIIGLLDNSLEQTRFLAIRAVNDLRLYDGKVIIKERYSGETKRNRLEIIRALKNIGTDEDFEFLEAIIRQGTVTEKTEACRSLYFMNTKGPEVLQSLGKDKALTIDRFLAHVTDPRN